MHGFDLDFVARRAPRSRQPGAHVERVSEEVWRVALWGELPVGWAGHLSAGLAELGVDIRRGSARCTEERGWLAEFEVTRHSDVDPSLLDCLHLCREDRGRSDTALVLSHFELTRAAMGGSLELGVNAPDRLGFLGSLLGRLAFFSLFPESLRVTTSRGTAVDVFRLRSLGGTSPSQAIERIARSFLEACRRSPSSAPRSRSSCG